MDQFAGRRALRAMLQDVPGTVGHDGSRFTFKAAPSPCHGMNAGCACDRHKPKPKRAKPQFPWEEAA